MIHFRQSVLVASYELSYRKLVTRWILHAILLFPCKGEEEMEQSRKKGSVITNFDYCVRK